MRKVSTKSMKDDLRLEYDLTKLKGGVRGKYYQRALAGTNLVLVEPDLAKAFPDTNSVNRALRALLNAVGATSGSYPRQGNVSLKKARSFDVACKTDGTQAHCGITIEYTQDRADRSLTKVGCQWERASEKFLIMAELVERTTVNPAQCGGGPASVGCAFG